MKRSKYIFTGYFVAFLFPLIIYHASEETTSPTPQTLDLNQQLVTLIESKKVDYGSNFKSCKINLWEDYVYFLAKNGLLSYELTLAAAEYVVGGEGVQDLWGDKSGGGPNIHERLKALFSERAQKRKLLRDSLFLESHKTNQILLKLKEHTKFVSEQVGNAKEIEKRGRMLDEYIVKTLNNTSSGDLESIKQAIEKWGSRKVQLECLCLYQKGLPNLPEDKKSRYANMCPEFFAEDKAKLDEGPSGLATGDASGLKYKRILVYWAFINTSLHDAMFVSEEDSLNQITEFMDWYNSLDWYAVEKRYLGSTGSGGKAFFNKKQGAHPYLYEFTEHKSQKKNGTWQDEKKYAYGPPHTTALLPENVRKVFNINENPSPGSPNGLYASIIAGMFGIGTDTPHPIIPKQNDAVTSNWAECEKNRNHRMVCRDMTRHIEIPYNEQCENPTPAAACVKKWLSTTVQIESSQAGNSVDETRFLIDPWIPIGVKEDQIIKDKVDYSSMDDNNRIWKAYDNLVKEFYTFPTTTFILRPRNGPPMNGWSDDPPKKCAGTRPCVAADGHQVESVNEESIQWWVPKLHPNPPEGPAYLRPDEQQAVKANAFTAQELIKSKAEEHIVSVGLLREDFTELLKSYKEYVYKFHYIFPRLADRDALEYPPVGFHSYLAGLEDVLTVLTTKQQGLGSGSGGSNGGSGSEDILSLTKSSTGGSNGGSGSGKKGQWGKLLDNYVKNLMETSSAFQKFQSSPLGVGRGGQHQQTRLKAPRFSPQKLFDLGFREWGLIVSEGQGLLSSSKKGSGIVHPNTEALNAKLTTNANFAVAQKRFQKNQERRGKEQEHWEKTVGQTQRGKNLRNATRRFRNTLYNPMSQGGLENVFSDNLIESMEDINSWDEGQNVGLIPDKIRMENNRSLANTDDMGGLDFGGDGLPYNNNIPGGGQNGGSVLISNNDMVNKSKKTESYCRDGSLCRKGLCNDGKKCVSRMTSAEEAKRLGISLKSLEILRKTAAAVNNKNLWEKFLKSFKKEKSLFDILSLVYLKSYPRFVIPR